MRELKDRIEGATLVDDISDLKIPWVKTQDQLNRIEAENIRRAQRKYFRKRSNFFESCLTENYFGLVHFAMFNNVWKWAGKWRKRDTNIGVSPVQIIFQLRELCKDLKYWHQFGSDLSVLERGAILHHRLVRIHPFVNGNGRHARLISDLYLLNYDTTIPR